MSDTAAAAPQPLEPSAITVVPASALEAMTRAEMDTQIGTARKYRRSLAQFKSMATAMATLDQETAASCSYSLPRDGKVIEGPSIRLAEIVVSTWGNLRAGSRLIDEAEKTVTAQAYCHDLETNVAITVEVRRKITTRAGVRFRDDMVNTTAAAACAIALRNAIFNVVPRVFVDQVRHAAMRTAQGDETTLATRREAALAHFQALGVSAARVLARLAEAADQPKTGLEDITLRDMVTLHGFATSLRDGMATVDELFPLATGDEPASKAAQIAADLKSRTRKKAEPPA